MLSLHMSAITLIGSITSVPNIWFCKLAINVILKFCHHVQHYYFNLCFEYKNVKKYSYYF
jgi:hypothetical protein